MLNLQPDKCYSQTGLTVGMALPDATDDAAVWQAMAAEAIVRWLRRNAV